MSTSIDRIVINTRERAVSSDINRLQDLMGQGVSEILRGVSGSPDYPPDVSPEDRNCVLRGLTGSPGVGMSVDFLEGHALVMAPGAVGADDSRYRLLHSRSTENVVLAASDPANDRWDLVEVTYSDDITESPLRDIYDPVTGTFAPVAVTKVRRAGATFQVQTGVPGANPALPAFSGGAFIPVAAVRVAAASVAVVQNDICDLRPLWAPASQQRQHGVVRGLEVQGGSLTADSASFYVRAGHAIVDGQLVRRGGDSFMNLSDHLDPGVVLAANTWFYVYLFTCRDATNMRARYSNRNAPTVEGFVVVTDVPPDDDGYPSAAVDFPTAGSSASFTLFSGDTSARGLYLGAIYIGAVPGQCVPQWRDGEWVRLGITNIFSSFVAGASPSTNTVAALNVPTPCDFVEVEANVAIAANADQSLLTFRIRPVGSSISMFVGDWTPQTIAEQKRLGRAKVQLTAGKQYDVRLQAGGVDRWNGETQVLDVCAVHDPRHTV